MTADSTGFADPAIRLPDSEALRRIRDVVPASHKGSAAPPLGEQTSRRLELAGRLLVAASIASLAIPKSHEGATLFNLSRQHGLTTSSLISLVGLVVGLFMLAKVKDGFRQLWTDSLASSGGPLVCLGVGLGVSATLLSDGLEWMWVPAGGLVLLGLSLHKPHMEPHVEHEAAP
jgi:hypothetical protein